MTTPLSLEQRILIAAEYNADRVEVIKELMRDNAVGFNEWVEKENFCKWRGRWYERINDGRHWGDFPSYSKEELYELYLLQSNKQVKP